MNAINEPTDPYKLRNSGGITYQESEASDSDSSCENKENQSSNKLDAQIDPISALKDYKNKFGIGKNKARRNKEDREQKSSAPGSATKVGYEQKL